MDKLDNDTVAALERRAFDLRADNLTAIAASASGHPGGTLSAMDIMQTRFFVEMQHGPKEPHWADRDRFVLSKGHAVPALYAVLAHAGYFSRSCCRRCASSAARCRGTRRTPHARASRRPPARSARDFRSRTAWRSRPSWMAASSASTTMIGDGESQEGQIWEAAMSAPKFKLDNLIVILDYNKGQIDGLVKDVMNLEPIADKWRAFNWNVLAHRRPRLRARSRRRSAEAKATKGKPTFILADTVKGKGVSFMEGNSWLARRRADDGGAARRGARAARRKAEHEGMAPCAPVRRTHRRAKAATRDAFGEALVRSGRDAPGARRARRRSRPRAPSRRCSPRSSPDRFFEMGIAEANMIGTAAGLALAGKVPFCCSFACFVTGRFDQIRMSVAYSAANVRIVGTHAGVGIGEDGYSQMGLEDIALMRVAADDDGDPAG